MLVKTLRKFKDLKEGKLRAKGQEFEVTEDRFKEINSTKYGELVEEIKEEDTEVNEVDPEYPKHTGGGYYELSNGEKVQGKEKAIEAENELK